MGDRGSPAQVVSVVRVASKSPRILAFAVVGERLGVAINVDDGAFLSDDDAVAHVRRHLATGCDVSVCDRSCPLWGVTIGGQPYLSD